MDIIDNKSSIENHSFRIRRLSGFNGKSVQYIVFDCLFRFEGRNQELVNKFSKSITYCGSGLFSRDHLFVTYTLCNYMGMRVFIYEDHLLSTCRDLYVARKHQKQLNKMDGDERFLLKRITSMGFDIEDPMELELKAYCPFCELRVLTQEQTDIIKSFYIMGTYKTVKDYLELVGFKCSDSL